MKSGARERERERERERVTDWFLDHSSYILLGRACHFEHADPTAQPPIVHIGGSSPLSTVCVQPLYRLKVGTPIKSSHHIELSVDDANSSSTASTVHSHHCAPLVSSRVVPDIKQSKQKTDANTVLNTQHFYARDKFIQSCQNRPLDKYLCIVE